MMKSYPNMHEDYLQSQSNAWLSLLSDLPNDLTSQSAMLSGGVEAVGLPQALRILQFFLQTFPAIDTYEPNILGNPESFTDHAGFILRKQLEPLFEACELDNPHSSLEQACDVQAEKCVINLSTLSSDSKRNELLKNLFELMQGLAYVVIQNPLKEHKKSYKAAVKVFYGESSQQFLHLDQCREKFPQFFILAADVLKLFSYVPDLLKAKPSSKTWPNYLETRSHNLRIIANADYKNNLIARNGACHTFSKMLTDAKHEGKPVKGSVWAWQEQPSMSQSSEKDALKAVPTASKNPFKTVFSAPSTDSLQLNDLLQATSYSVLNTLAQGDQDDSHLSIAAQLQQLGQSDSSLDQLWPKLTAQQQYQLLIHWFTLRQLETRSSDFHSGDTCSEELFLKIYENAVPEVWQQIHDWTSGDAVPKGAWFDEEKKQLKKNTILFSRRVITNKHYLQPPEAYYLGQFLKRQYERCKLSVPLKISEVTSTQINWSDKSRLRCAPSRELEKHQVQAVDLKDVVGFGRVVIAGLSFLSAVSVAGLLVLMAVSNTLMMTQLALVLIPALVWIHAQMYHLFYEKMRPSLKGVGFNVLGAICFLGLGAIAAFIVPTNFITPPIFMACILLSIPPLISEVCCIMRWGYPDVPLNHVDKILLPHTLKKKTPDLSGLKGAIMRRKASTHSGQLTRPRTPPRPDRLRGTGTPPPLPPRP